MPEGSPPLPHSQTHHTPCSETRLRRALARAGHRPPHHSTPARPSQPGYHRPLSAHRHEQGLFHHQSARSTPPPDSHRDEAGDSSVLLSACPWIVPSWKSPTCCVATAKPIVTSMLLHCPRRSGGS